MRQHDQLHKEERAQYERLLRRSRVDRLADRMAVAEVFLSSDRHLTALDWWEMLGPRRDDLSPEFVEDTLNKLTGLGLCNKVEDPAAGAIYEHSHIGDHHDHLICTQCGKVTEFERPKLEELKRSVADELGFHHLHHKLVIYGVCRECLSDRKPDMPLGMAQVGETVRVERVTGATEVKNQIHGLGIVVGSQLRVISRNNTDVVVSMESTRLALGREISSRIYVATT